VNTNKQTAGAAAVILAAGQSRRNRHEYATLSGELGITEHQIKKCYGNLSGKLN
jgi:hypothetical protein